MENQLTTILSLTNPFAQEQLKEGIQAWPKTLDTCISRAESFASLQRSISNYPKKLNKSLDDFKDLNDCVKGCDALLRDSTDVEKEGYEQVCFRGIPWSLLNTIPYALLALSIYKSYIVPGFGLLLPVISWILPYIMLRSLYNIPITFGEYSSILMRMWNGQRMPRTPEELFAPAPLEPMDAFTQMRTILQNGWTIFTIGQALWQPIQQARHFMRLDTDCLKLGDLVVRVKGIAERITHEWKPWIPQWLMTWIPMCPSDSRQAFAFALETPFWLRHTFRALGRIEILLTLAGREDVVPAQFVKSSEPVLMIKNFGDPSIPLDKRVKSSVRLGGGKIQHSVLTGPNRGGKSSFLRGILMNVVVAHSFGAAFAEKAQMTSFTWIADGMRLDDSPGEQSMFEREVAFGSGVLEKSGGRGLVLYDELFHSTNPPDAKRTSELFCDRLWKKTNCVSIVSTHVYSLARAAPPTVSQLCVAAWKMKDKYKFSYNVQKGVCEVSSVDLLLKQFGML